MKKKPLNQNQPEAMALPVQPEPLKDQNPTLLLPTLDGIDLLPVYRIRRITAERAYSRFFLTDGSTLLASQNIGVFETMLEKIAACFFRTHDSHLINVRCVRRFLFEDGGTLLLDDGAKIPVSKRRKKAFLEWLRTAHAQ